SRCSPPRLTTTQLRSDTKFKPTSTRTCTSQIQSTCKRTSRHAPRDEPKRDTTPNVQDASTSVKRSAHHAERDGYVGGYKRGGGRVRFLEDTDGDGKYDKSTLFLDKLNFPNGVMAWRDGVLISAAPEVLFARDTNGDGRADEVKVLLTGFGEGNQQHRVNGFSWGLDNMVHCANGDSGGQTKVIGTVREGEAPAEPSSDGNTP
ncbi:MAG: hypothetical protein NT013_13605, partial [Planctomycetia bacterium]|nr:hypothetical protein [Planctomycetia bacterium]